jgi:hypothetical protein
MISSRFSISPEHGWRCHISTFEGMFRSHWKPVCTAEASLIERFRCLCLPRACRSAAPVRTSCALPLGTAAPCPQLLRWTSIWQPQLKPGKRRGTPNTETATGIPYSSPWYTNGLQSGLIAAEWPLSQNSGFSLCQVSNQHKSNHIEGKWLFAYTWIWCLFCVLTVKCNCTSAFWVIMMITVTNYLWT